MSQTAGTTKIDTEVLDGFIAELNTLKGTWEGKTDKPVDVGECGGKMITEIEALGNVVMDAREAFVNLLKQTISYMEKRKESFEEIEEEATATIQESTVSDGNVTSVVRPGGVTAEVK